MLKIVSYAFIFLFEIAVTFLYFESIFSKRESRISRYLFYFMAYVLLFGISFFSIPIFNLPIFVITTVYIAYFCYETNFRICTFHVLMLTVFMLITEMVVVYFSSSILNINLDAYTDNISVLIAQASLSKLLYFIVAYIALRISIKDELKKKQGQNKLWPLLGLLPITSMIFLCVLTYFATIYTMPALYDSILTIGTILLLFSNIVVFYVYQLIVKTNIKYTRLQLERQKESISNDYYELLKNEYESSQILVHDIKRHLRLINQIASDENGEKVIEYIDSICEDFGFNSKINYSGNKLVDVIVNRYVQKCKTNGISVEIDVRGSNLDFMTNSDITALLDNLLDNSVEAAINSQHKQVFFSIFEENDNFIVIETINSCDLEPKQKRGRLITSKSGSFHGIGIKSIIRVVSKYEGNINWSYDENLKSFEICIVLKEGRKHLQQPPANSLNSFFNCKVK